LVFLCTLWRNAKIVTTYYSRYSMARAVWLSYTLPTQSV
jgi:hypothetical protein